ncbi:site-2 protease family protein [Haloprofundus salilacus]|uniref:site-2 protease family protein n=1 Tax=Haloprofundus salilacus TaxID=2876190 RepID=UPI001CC9684E|nr:site-2 protease family protein [Haloprofundus salilacus]
MDEADSPPYGPATDPADGPSLERLGSVFYVREVRTDDDRLLYYGESLVSRRSLLEEVWPSFRRTGYDVRLARTNDGLDVLVAEPVSVGVEGVPWKNLLLLAATVASTLLVGAYAWYYIPISRIQENPFVALEAWPFTAAVLGVLCAHELGHYVMGRYHGVDVSLPYLIPFIFPFGTMGAIIRMRGQMPDRKALFDIGVAGPLSGLAATILVTAIGLSLDPITIPERVFVGSSEVIRFNNPLLLDLIATFLGQPSDYSYPQTVNPVIIGGWVGMFFTVLNLLPVGQLDGGHMVRAMLGRRQETVATLVPLGLFGLAGYLYYVRDLGLQESVGLWAFWGLFSLFIAFNGPAHPIDESSIGWKRQLVGVFTFALGLLCFMLVPIQLMSA